MQNVALLTRDSAPNVALLERTPAAVAPAITTTALPGGIVGTAYSQVIQVTGTEPITASILSGALPGGLTLAGATRTISGTPTAPVNAAFTVRASNSAGNADKALGILIPNEGVGGPAPAVTTVTLVPVSATVEAGGTTDLIVTVEDQAGNPIANIVGTVESTAASNATGAWLAPTDASGQATVRVTGIAAGGGVSPSFADLSAVADGLRSNACAVTITPPTGAAVTGVAVTPSAPSISVSQQQQFAASVTGVGSFDPSVVWSVQSGGGSITPGGIYSAPATPTAAVVRATSAAHPSVFGEATITVNPAAVIDDVAPSALRISEWQGGARDLRVQVLVSEGSPAGLVVSAASSDAQRVAVATSAVADANGIAVFPAQFKLGGRAVLTFSLGAQSAEMLAVVRTQGPT